MKKDKKAKWFKGILLLIVLVIAIAMIVYLAPIMKEISTPEGQQTFKQKVDESGLLGVLMLFGIQLAQIFLIILPGEPLEIIAGMCYGSVWGTVFVMASAGIISTAIVFLVRKLRKKFCLYFLQRRKNEENREQQVISKSKENGMDFCDPIFNTRNAKGLTCLFRRTLTN